MADPSESSTSYDTALRHIWKVGETFQIHTEPTVEGMIAGTRWINEAFMVIFIVPPCTKTDGTKEKASILLRTPSACSRTKLDKYEFPFPPDSNIYRVVKAKGSHLLLQDVLTTLNHKPVFLPSTPASLPTETGAGNFISAPSSLPLLQQSHKELTEISDQLSVQLALSQAREAPSQLPAHLQDEHVLDHLARELSRRFTFTKPASTFSDDIPIHSQPPPPAPHPLQKSKPIRSLHSTSSSSTSRRTGSFSTSSPSRSSSSSKSHKVRYHRKRHSSGFFSCPFSASDTRQLARPSKKIHAKSEERKYLRYALHDLYSEFSTLKNFVDSLRTELVSSPTKPYTSDLIWLQHHADYLDSLFLHMSAGPWTAWNELITDKLTRAFLELIVRVSPKRQYPDLLEEPVRKWMKRKRIGIASQYGPIPSFLSQAKVTDTGIEPKNGWDSWRNKDNTLQYGATGGIKTKPPATGYGDKK